MTRLNEFIWDKLKLDKIDQSIYKKMEKCDNIENFKGGK